MDEVEDLRRRLGDRRLPGFPKRATKPEGKPSALSVVAQSATPNGAVRQLNPGEGASGKRELARASDAPGPPAAIRALRSMALR
jgi:hypothetical protein